MKKGFTAFLAVMVFAVMSCVVINSEECGETHIHKHAHAAAAYWQCWECGMRVMSSGNSPTDFGCDVSRNGQHVWRRLYSSDTSVYWQCIKCGESAFASIPGEFGCSRNKSRCHVWQRQ